ncbi:PH domain-containing protein [Mucilaginibacter ginsenosidivorax]|uniref:PH domain-containing protein n=1 Tax=Mucilaginibacter ginsenosidivorax TaxID=862126 RepID=A0A5B8VVF3_9SPHI|nr:PH domain-containing protein [Mucilaginibacter ginsenosidivorax]QEC74585.1 PH domain-containing protein [Mucilaginibacter ginsenosidivorax]
MTQNDDIVLKPAVVFTFFKVLPLILLALTFLLLAWWLSPYFILFSFAVCGAAWYRILYIRSFQYLFTAEYIRITRGIFFKRIDQAEMFRVKDFIITQSFALQLFKLMNLTLISTDNSNQVIYLQGIPESDIVDTIRNRVEETRRLIFTN